MSRDIRLIAPKPTAKASPSSTGYVTVEMLHAGVKKAVDNGLLPNRDVGITEYTTMCIQVKEVIDAAIKADNK